MARNPDKRPCLATTASGRPCRNHARSDSDYCNAHGHAHSPDAPPTLAGAPLDNANSRIHGLYAKFMTEDDLASLAIVGVDATLDDEIAFTRVVIRRLAQMIDAASTIDEAVRISDGLLRGTGHVAALLKTKRALSGQAADGIAGAIGVALDELGNLWDLKL